MKYTIRERLLLAAQFAILAAQVIGLSFVIVGNADEVSGMTITSQRPYTSDSVATYHDEIHARARVAAWLTRYNAMNGLGLKLIDDHASDARLAETSTGKRG